MGSFTENKRIRVNGVPILSMQFSAGEEQVRLPEGSLRKRADVVAFIRDSSDMMQLFLTCKAIERIDRGTLTLPYFSYSRQDRSCYKGEAASADLIAQIIDSFNFQHFVTVDMHNEETLSGINGYYNEMPIFCHSTYDVLKSEEFTHVVAPDKGAIDRAKVYAAKLNLPLIRAEKTRDPLDGKITGFGVLDYFEPGANLLIADDICDGGGTFIGLASQLKVNGANKVSLMVAHGIFSKGLGVLRPSLDAIYYTNSRGQNPDLPYYHLFVA